jgi:twitching motility protein PilT
VPDVTVRGGRDSIVRAARGTPRRAWFGDPSRVGQNGAMVDVNVAGIEEYLEEMWDRNGTDLLVTVDAPPLVRIDGALYQLPDRPSFTSADTDRIVHGLLGEALGARFEADGEVDFSFSWHDRARFRGNAFRQRGSAALALRLIPYRIPTFEELGLPEIASQLVDLPQGLILVTGPTGAGKSTTLASMLDTVNERRAGHIVTIEDPIEYVHRHRRSAISQREVGSDTASFARGLRSAFREDPDVLLIGEMRDNETIQTALTIAETGHLVFATLHTNDAAQTLDRVVDVFPGDQQAQIRVQLAGSLQAILSQRLIPRIGGGRVAAFEVLTATFAVRNIVREGRTNQLRNIIATSSREGMLTLEQSLSGLVLDGSITYEEAVTHSLFPNEIARPPTTPQVAAAQRA